MASLSVTHPVSHLVSPSFPLSLSDNKGWLTEWLHLNGLLLFNIEDNEPGEWKLVNITIFLPLFSILPLWHVDILMPMALWLTGTSWPSWYPRSRSCTRQTRPLPKTKQDQWHMILQQHSFLLTILLASNSSLLYLWKSDWSCRVGASTDNFVRLRSHSTAGTVMSRALATTIQYQRYCIRIRTGRDEGYTVKYSPSPEGVPEGEARGNSQRRRASARTIQCEVVT